VVLLDQMVDQMFSVLDSVLYLVAQTAERERICLLSLWLHLRPNANILMTNNFVWLADLIQCHYLFRIENIFLRLSSFVLRQFIYTERMHFCRVFLPSFLPFSLPSFLLSFLLSLPSVPPAAPPSLSLSLSFFLIYLFIF
jgi:hypothetical protein